VVNQGSTVSQYSINQLTGALTQIATAIATGNNPRCIAVDPTGKYVYVTTYNGGTISQFLINQSTGVLTAIAAEIATGNNPYGVVVDPTGRFVYTANNSDNTVSHFTINNFGAGTATTFQANNYTRTKQSLTPAAGTATIDFNSGSAIVLTLTNAISGWTLLNVPTSSVEFEFRMYIIINGGSISAWP
jgi:6-phosphogluconolactonase (cycloisomerase 2 family)